MQVIMVYNVRMKQVISLLVFFIATQLNAQDLESVDFSGMPTAAKLMDSWMNENNITIESRDGNKNSLLHQAVNRNSYELVEYLIEKGINIEAENKYNTRALHLAVRYKHFNLVSLLLEHGALADAKDVSGNTPLEYAIQTRFSQGIAALLKKGAELPLKAAEVSEETLSLLLEDVNLLADNEALDRLKSYRDRNGNSLIHTAARNGMISGVETLIAHGFNIHVRNNQQQTALLVAAQHNKRLMIDLLLSLGADSSAKDVSGWNLIMYAVKSGDHERLIYEISNGYSVNAKTHVLTLLDLAVRYGHDRIVRWLLDNGADPRLCELPLLLEAVKHDRIELVHHLLQYDVPVNMINYEGNTALHLAAFFQQNEIVSLLLQNGANRNLANVHGWTPSFMAIRNLYARNTETTTEIVKQLMPENVNILDTNGRTMLFYCALNNDLNTASYLVEKGCDPRIADYDGKHAIDMLGSISNDRLSQIEWEDILGM